MRSNVSNCLFCGKLIYNLLIRCRFLFNLLNSEIKLELKIFLGKMKPNINVKSLNICKLKVIHGKVIPNIL